MIIMIINGIVRAKNITKIIEVDILILSKIR